MSKGPTSTATGATITTTNPTNILSCVPPRNYQDTLQPFVPNSNPPITVKFAMNITPGTATTSVSLKLFNNANTQIGLTQQTPVTAAVAQNVDATFLDTSGVEPGLYTVQVTQNAATGNGTVNFSTLYALTDG